ncbi:MAG: aspartate kinase [Oscillospiraceae bacterium]|nr:aspartate kinase [Oscillospiraceae bacterium]
MDRLNGAVGIKTVKFGGSSLADAECLKKVAAIIKADENRRYVVPSAPGKRFKEDEKVTDMLYALHKAAAEGGEEFEAVYNKIYDRFDGIVKGLGIEFSLKEELDTIKNNLLAGYGSDYAASRGEYLNGKILATYIGFTFVDPANVVVFKENGVFDAKKTDELMSAALAKCDKAVVPGFYGAYENGQIKTFSRGGSDVTGSIVAKAANAVVYENWTDVSGFLMADPRIVDSPKQIRTITYRELRELSYMGATVLHEDAIFPVRKAGIPINIRNTNIPEEPGTMIVASAPVEPQNLITGIAGHKGFSTVIIEKDMMNQEVGFGRKVLDVFEKFGVSFEHLPSGIDTLSVVVETKELEKATNLVDELYKATEADHIYVENGIALIAVVGRGMIQARGTAARVFAAVAHADVNVKMIDQGSSELNIIIGVKEEDFEKSIKAIYEIFDN